MSKPKLHSGPDLLAAWQTIVILTQTILFFAGAALLFYGLQVEAEQSFWISLSNTLWLLFIMTKGSRRARYFD